MIRDARRKPITLRGVRSNAGVRVAYQRKLFRLIDGMDLSYRYWIIAQWRRKPPALAADASPAAEMKQALRGLGKQWRERFDDGAEELGRFFADRSWRDSSAQLRVILKRAGFTVDMAKMTRAMQDVMRATIEENVSLIKSIPEEYHTQVEGIVMRSFTSGRDLRQLTRDLRARYDISRDRAELIARDQSNKATAAFARVRYLDLGLKQAVWLHSGGGKTARPTHKKNNGQPYDIRKGWYDPAVKRRIHPGELINCRCVAKPIVKGFS